MFVGVVSVLRDTPRHIHPTPTHRIPDNIPLGGSCIKMPWAIGGSGSTFIYGLCDSEFQDNMSKDEANRLVKLALSHAMARDGSSGGIIRTVTVTEEGNEREYVPGDQLPFGP